MANETLDAAAIRARINEILVELDQLSAPSALVGVGRPFVNEELGPWLRRDSKYRNDAVRSREDRIKARLLELSELREALPVEGMACGKRLVINRALGEFTLPPLELEPPRDDRYNANDPYDRYEREQEIDVSHR